MSRKETDLQKVISEIKASLQDKDLENLKNSVLSKVKSDTDVADLLKDNNLEASLQNLLKNPNIATLLSNPELSEQITNLLKNQPKDQLIDQLKKALNIYEKKK